MAIFQQRVGFTQDLWSSITANSSSGALNNVSTDNLSTIRFTNATSISGFANPYDGKELEIINGNTSDLEILNENSGSLAANRILCPDGNDVLLPSNGSLRFRYSSTSSRWHVVGGPGGGGGSGQRNYLERWFRAISDPGAMTGIAENANVTTDVWHSSTGPLFTLTKTTVSPLREKTSYISGANTSASTGGTVFFQTPRFTLDNVDLGKPIMVSFDISGINASGDWDVLAIRYNSSGVFQERIPIAGHISSSTLAPSAQLPSGVSTFRGFFIPSSTSGDYYSIRFRRLSGAEQIRLDSLFVGPQVFVSGPAITDWIQIDPPAVGSTRVSNAFRLRATTTNPTLGAPHPAGNEAYYRHLGDSVHFRMNIAQSTAGTAGSGVYEILLPTEFDADLTKLNSLSTTGGVNVVGTAILQTSTSIQFCSCIVVDTGVLRIESTAAADWWSSSNTVNWSNATCRFAIDVVIPIVNRSSSILLAERAVEEYVFNTSTSTTTSDTTSFGYGPGGFQIGNITAALNRRVRFRTPILASDKIFVEVNNGNGWYERDSYFPNVSQNTTEYGMTLVQINSTDIDVVFRQYADTYSNGTYGAAGRAWSTFGTWLWRVRKVSGGAAVGYPVDVRNVIDGRAQANTEAYGFSNNIANGTYSTTTNNITETLSKPTASGKMLVTATLTYRYDNFNGTSMQTGARITVLEGSTTLYDTPFDTIVVPTGFGGVLTRSISFIVTSTNSTPFTVRASEYNAGGGAYSATAATLSTSASLVRV